jgi:hypothetical protein
MSYDRQAGSPSRVHGFGRWFGRLEQLLRSEEYSERTSWGRCRLRFDELGRSTRQKGTCDWVRHPRCSQWAPFLIIIRRFLRVHSLDVGGTSTDVSRFDGRYEVVYETTTAGVTVQSPQLDINTVAAGGGSCLTFRNGLFLAGPESAGANPGPACYR